MSNDLQSLFQKIKIDAHTANFSYVYYEKKDGSIHKISPRKEHSDYEILEIDHNEAKPFLVGEKKTIDYKVSYDILLKTVVLKNINENNAFVNFNKILYQIPRNNTSAELTIEQDLKNSLWKISILDNTLNFIKQHDLSSYNKILLSITKKDDPNILYRTLYIDLSEIVEKSISIPFKFEFEYKGHEVSIYTNKYFESYSYKVIG